MKNQLKKILMGAVALASITAAGMQTASARGGGCADPRYDRYGCLCAIGELVEDCQTVGGYPGRTQCRWVLPCLKFPSPPFGRGGFRL